MKRRDFIQKTGLVTAGASIVTISACNAPNPSEKEANSPDVRSVDNQFKAYELPALSYAHSALEPMIDEKTMTIHHERHHAGYVKKLNAALESYPNAGQDLDLLLTGLSESESDLGVRNNGGGHYNHSLFWRVMTPGKANEPMGELADALNSHFGSVEGFKKEFGQAAATVFGSGWAWLCVDDKDELFITSTPNQDNPLMKGLVENPGRPILGIDVWEHAYYLKYQNKRKDYIQAFTDLINWEVVSSNLKG